jgi:uncharacterized protein YjbI with pentapeptide repeats
MTNIGPDNEGSGIVNSDFTGANASNANFTKSGLYASNLTNANFSGANLSNTEIGHSNLQGTNFVGANFTGVLFGPLSGTAQFMVAPVGAADSVSTGIGSPITVNVVGNDTNANGVANGRTLVASEVSNPPHGTASVNADGTVTYTPDANYSGPDSFTYRPRATMPAAWAMPEGVSKEAIGDPVTVTVSIATRVSPITGPWVGKTGTEGLVTRLYGAYFKRNPDQAGFNFWMAEIRNGRWTNAKAAQFFSTSPEFARLYGGNLSNEAFLTLTYRNVFDRAPDSGGQAYWLGRLSNGLSRGEMVLFFSDSPEYRAFTGTN